jgi:hypothetical protein
MINELQGAHLQGPQANNVADPIGRQGKSRKIFWDFVLPRGRPPVTIAGRPAVLGLPDGRAKNMAAIRNS